MASSELWNLCENIAIKNTGHPSMTLCFNREVLHARFRDLFWCSILLSLSSWPVWVIFNVAWMEGGSASVNCVGWAIKTSLFADGKNELIFLSSKTAMKTKQKKSTYTNSWLICCGSFIFRWWRGEFWLGLLEKRAQA